MTARLIIGSTIHELRALEPGSVDLVVTSPPFLGVRDYGPADDPMKAYELGRGGSPQSFVADLLDFTDACAHALAPHGSLVIELGDTMAGSGGAGGDYYNEDGQRAGQPKPPGAAKLAREAAAGFDGGSLERRRAKMPDRREDPDTQRRPAATPMRQSSPRYRGGTQRWDKRDGILRADDTVTYPIIPTSGEGWPLDKSHALIPEQLRLAMAYGQQPFSDRTCVQWIVRNVVRWCKPNPSVGFEGDKYRRATTDMVVAALSEQRWWDLLSARGPARGEAGATAPLYDWWEIPTGTYRGAHFATWPLDLVNPLIGSMCPHKVCTTCGLPARRIIQASAEYAEQREPGDMFARLTGENDRTSGRNGDAGAVQSPSGSAEYEHVGWTWCGHDGDPHVITGLASRAEWRAAGKPRWQAVLVGETFAGYLQPGATVTPGDPSSGRRGVVCDPFAGTGSTLAAAVGAGRDAIGMELYEKHAHLAADRMGMFLTIEHGTAHLDAEAAG